MSPRAALYALYATLPPSAQRVRVECMTDAEVDASLSRWQAREERRRQARAALDTVKHVTMGGKK